MVDDALPAVKLDALRSAMETYFIDEKWISALLIAAGAIAIVIGWLLWRNGSIYKTAAYPLVIVALLQVAVGAAIYQRTDDQLSGLWSQVNEAPQTYQAEETARMTKVLSSFKLYKILELLMLVGGIGICFAFRDNMSWYAAGVGLFAEGALMLLIDLTAEKRADFYVAAIKDAFG
jgi:hypothetical protein